MVKYEVVEIDVETVDGTASIGDSGGRVVYASGATMVTLRSEDGTLRRVPLSKAREMLK